MAVRSRVRSRHASNSVGLRVVFAGSQLSWVERAIREVAVAQVRRETLAHHASFEVALFLVTRSVSEEKWYGLRSSLTLRVFISRGKAC